MTDQRARVTTHWGLDGALHQGGVDSCAEPSCTAPIMCESCQHAEGRVLFAEPDGEIFRLCSHCAAGHRGQE